MPYNQNDFYLQKKQEHNFDLKLNQEQKFNLTLQNQYNFSLNLLGFAVSRSIYIKLKHTIKTTIGFLLKSNMHLISNVNLKVISSFKMIKKYLIDIDQNVKIHIDFLIKKKVSLISTSGIRIGKTSTLGLLDILSLNDLDNKTLDQLNFIYGIVLKVKKRMLGLSKSAILLTTNIKLYRYNKLLIYDGLTLNELDNQTLGNLDRLIIQ